MFVAISSVKIQTIMERNGKFVDWKRKLNFNQEDISTDIVIQEMQL